MATAAYTRCSTEEQNDRLQRQEIQAWADRNGVADMKWFADKATGTNTNRPGWQKLLRAVSEGDSIVCWRLDRITRSLRDAANLFAYLTKRNIRLVSMRENIDLDSATGRMVCGILATIAEFEHSIRADRQRSGIAAAKKAGERWGGSNGGWLAAKTRQKAEAVFTLSKAGTSINKISQITGLAYTTVQKLLRPGVPAHDNA
jgi:DNA invertase Pin-like site-specific DNA recombinase